jgi:tRNA (adenine57-N1/adenine58-N1)-methyltransferase
MGEIKKILMSKEGRKFFVRDLTADMHTQFGYVAAKDLKAAKDGDILISNTKQQFTVYSPFFIDAYKKIKRGAQIIPLKDIGFIIAETGIGKNSRVLDAGVGSGATAFFLAHVCKEVVSYEIRDDFLAIAKKNQEFLGIKNLKIFKKDIYEGISEKSLDVVILDVPEPWKAIGPAAKSLKIGGFLVSYSPSIPQTADFVNALTDQFIHIKTVEVMERQWEVQGRKVRPKTQAIGHSGFITFARKITR